ncbi:MAG: tetratricopeptide repeat protein [Muribaculaceae bacterium]|nr:tetratricopeptide repeat protein [Muribaculaceae bacterium]
MKLSCVSRMFVLVMTVALMGVSQVWAAGQQEVNAKDKDLMEKAIYFMDNGMPYESIDLLTSLCKKYPTNKTIMHELVLANVIVQDYAEGYKWAKELIKLEDADEENYSLAGSAMDYYGKHDEAISVYDEGLKKFPKSGRLLLEKGNMCYSQKDYDGAVSYYEQALEIDPAYDASYYRLARLFGISTDPVWAIMYAQGYLFTGKDRDRRNEMSRLIYLLYHDNVTRKGGKVEATFAQHYSMSEYLLEDCDIPYELAFNALHESCAKEVMTADTLSLPEMIKLHERYVMGADTVVHDYYDVPVLQVERAALRAGKLHGCVMWQMGEAVFAYGKPDDFTEKDFVEADDFVEWYNNEYEPKITQRGVSHEHVTLTAMMPVPRMADLKDVKDCRAHRDEIKAVAQWMMNAPCDTTSALYSKSRTALFWWVMNTDEISLSIGTNPLVLDLNIFPYYIAAAINYCQDNKKKQLDINGYVEVMQRVVAYVRQHESSFTINDDVRRLLDMDNDALVSHLKDEFGALQQRK